MHTAGLAPGLPIPLPETINQYFPANSPSQFGVQGQGFRDADGDQIKNMVFPEGTSAFYLCNVLQLQLLNPTMPALTGPGTLSGFIDSHIKTMSSMGWRVGGSYM
jgi:hypothetical protein